MKTSKTKTKRGETKQFPKLRRRFRKREPQRKRANEKYYFEWAVLLLKIMSKKPKSKPLTNAERQQLFRARQAVKQEQKYWRGNWKIRKQIETTHPENLLEKWDKAHQAVKMLTLRTGKPNARKYHPDRPATGAERIAHYRTKRSGCSHSIIIFGRCENCRQIIRK